MLKPLTVWITTNWKTLQEAGQVVWYSHLLKNFPQFVAIYTIKAFGVVNKAEVDIFLELSCFFYDPTDVGNLISGSSTLPASWEICMQIKKQQIEPDMEQQSGSKMGKEYVKAVYCHPAYLTYMQSTSRKMLGWMKHKLESRMTGEISITSDMQMTPPLWQKVKRN